MIGNDVELQQATAQMGKLYEILAGLRRDLEQSSPRSYVLLAEGPLAEIARMQSEIDVYVGRARLESTDVDLWVGISGRGVRWRETPTSILTAFLDNLRKGVQAIAESSTTGRQGIRPTDALKQACDLELVELQPGSLQIGLRIPEAGRNEQDLFSEIDSGVGVRALSEFLKAADWVGSSRELEQLELLIADPQHRRRVLRALRQFVPRPRGVVDSIDLYGRMWHDAERIVLTKSAGARIGIAFGQSLAPQEVSFVGDVREIDLDARTFRLRNIEGVGELVCFYPPDMESSARAALDSRATVIGVQPRDAYGELQRRVELTDLAMFRDGG